MRVVVRRGLAPAVFIFKRKNAPMQVRGLLFSYFYRFQIRLAEERNRLAVVTDKE
jgi:hypothetical protein